MVVKGLKMKSYVVVYHVVLLFALIFKGCAHPSYAEAGLDLISMIISHLDVIV